MTRRTPPAIPTFDPLDPAGPSPARGGGADRDELIRRIREVWPGMAAALDRRIGRAITDATLAMIAGDLRDHQLEQQD